MSSQKRFTDEELRILLAESGDSDDDPNNVLPEIDETLEIEVYLESDG